jgi:hypothetical protein
MDINKDVHMIADRDFNMNLGTHMNMATDMEMIFDKVMDVVEEIRKCSWTLARG